MVIARRGIVEARLAPLRSHFRRSLVSHRRRVSHDRGVDGPAALPLLPLAYLAREKQMVTRVKPAGHAGYAPIHTWVLFNF
jgi:hypothetical protein